MAPGVVTPASPHRSPAWAVGEVTAGLCECGCGTPTPLAVQTRKARGWIKGQPVRFISRHHLTSPVRTPRVRLLEKTEKTDTCWLWAGSLTTGGYGQLSIAGRLTQAHRLAYELYVGAIPEGFQIDHLCRVRHCVNPDHLEAVTQAENIRRGMSPLAIAWRSGKCRRGHLRETGKECRECARILRKRTKDRLFGTEPPSHGNRYAYVVFGCRCDECRAASLAYHRANAVSTAGVKETCPICGIERHPNTIRIHTRKVHKAVS